MLDLNKALSFLLTPRIVQALGAIRELKGTEFIQASTHSEALKSLQEIARIKSISASNQIEGISTTDKKLRKLAAERIEPKNRDEREIAGYRFVLDLVRSSYNDIPITSGTILQLHRDLYRYLDVSFAGHWKDADNFIGERTADGSMMLRFKPTSAAATPGAMQQL